MELDAIQSGTISGFCDGDDCKHKLIDQVSEHNGRKYGFLANDKDKRVKDLYKAFLPKTTFLKEGIYQYCSSSKDSAGENQQERNDEDKENKIRRSVELEATIKKSEEEKLKAEASLKYKIESIDRNKSVEFEGKIDTRGNREGKVKYKQEF